MQIDPAQSRNSDQPSGDNLPKSDDDYCVRSHALEKFVCCIRLDRFGLIHVETSFQSHFLDRGGKNCVAAPARSVRLRHYRFYRESRVREKSLKRGHREFRSAAEDDAHVAPRNACQPAGELPFAGFLQLANAPPYQIALEQAQMFDE